MMANEYLRMQIELKLFFAGRAQIIICSLLLRRETFRDILLKNIWNSNPRKLINYFLD